MTASNDTPVTDAELDQFYGREGTEYEINQAILRHKRAFDADDLAEICRENNFVLLHALETDYAPGFYGVIQSLRKAKIANRASIEVYGRVGVIKPEEV